MSNKRRAMVTAEEFVSACGSNDASSLQTLREALKENPEFANATAVIQEVFRGRKFGGKTYTALQSALYNPEKVRLLLEHGANTETKFEEEDNTALTLACRRPGWRQPADIEVVKALLDHGADINVASSTGSTPLMSACAGGLADIVELLIQKGAEVEARSGNDRTPLLINCKGENCSPEVIQLLVDKGADVNTIDDEGFTPLMGACCNHNLEAARLLVQHGADVHACDFDNRTPLLGVCQDPLGDNATEMMRVLLDKGANPNVKRGCGCTAFSATVGMATLEQIRLLLDHGADINSGCQCDGRPLQVAIRNRNWDLAHFLLDRGAEIPSGFLLLAIQNGADRGLLATLLEKGALINQAKYTGESALSMASTVRKDLSLVQFLLEKGADVNARGDAHGSDPKYGSTPWLRLLSTIDATVEMVQLFLNAGANLKDVDSNGNTAFMLAKSVSIVQLLFKYDQDAASAIVNVANNDGDTALIHLARHDRTRYGANFDSVQIMRELLQHNSIDKNAKNHLGETALMVATRIGGVEVVKLLLDSGGVTVNKTNLSGQTALHLGVGSDCLVPVAPPFIMQGTMSIKPGPSLSIEGKWGTDEASSSDQMSRNNFYFRRSLENDEQTQLNQLELLGGTFLATSNLSFGRGGSMGFNDGHVRITFSLCTEGQADMGPVVYNVKGEEGGSKYGNVSITGTATLQPSAGGEGSCVKLKLTKTYEPGTVRNRKALQSLCETIDKTMRGEDSTDGRPHPDMAIHRDYLNIAGILLRHGADVSVQDSEGNLPLIVACQLDCDALDMVYLLLKHTEFST